MDGTGVGPSGDIAKVQRHAASSWLYWPSRAEYLVPWALGPALFIVLGALGYSTAVPQLVSRVAPSIGTSVLIIAIATMLNFVVLLTHIRSAYLSWKCVLRPTAGTLALLTVAYIFIAGASVSLHGEIKPAVFSGIQLNLTMHVAATGTMLLFLGLGFSAFFKIPEPNLSDLLRALDAALPVLSGVGPVTSAEYRDLLKALDTLRSLSVMGRITRRERQILEGWKESAGALYEKVKDRDVRDVRTILVEKEMKDHIAILQRTC